MAGPSGCNHFRNKRYAAIGVLSLDGHAVTRDGLGDRHEWSEAAPSRPLQPLLEEHLAALSLDFEDLPELFLQQVGAEERLIRAHNGGQLDPLQDGQILRVFQSANRDPLISRASSGWRWRRAAFQT
jgi:hypothetical protein